MKDYQLSAEVSALFDKLDQIAPKESACKKSCKDNYIFCKNSCWDHDQDCKDACRATLHNCLHNCYGNLLQSADGDKVKELIQSILTSLEKEDQQA